MANITTEIKNSIINEMEEELNERCYEYDRYYLDKIVTECFARKNDLIDVLSNHPLWNPEKLMIQFDTTLGRKIDLRGVGRFTDWLSSQLGTSVHYNYHGEQTKEYHVINFIGRMDKQFFDEDLAEAINHLNSLNENYKLRTNMKSSKAIGKICREEGWDKFDGYNREYAALCDALNPLTVTRHTCISVNPIDFLLMSNGNSWSSCHYIGDNDEEAGCYSSGTISYMLDEHSFIFYTVDASYDGNQIERQPKIQRQVFGYNDEVIAQLRLYPQENDCGADNIYDEFRATVQKVIADCLDKPNYWIKSRNDIGSVIEKGSYATCYPDWSYSKCYLSTHKERANGKDFRRITFGAEPICISCGCRHDVDENISCCTGGRYVCEDCGSRIYEDDVYWVGDYTYCCDCVSYCEHCEEYVPNENINEIDGVHVCDGCLEWSDDYYSCTECGEIHHYDNMTQTEDGDWYCEDCADELLEECENCGEYYLKSEMIEVDDCYVCKDCVEDNYDTCKNCGSLHNCDDMIYVESEDSYYCNDCAGELLMCCADCDEWYHKSKMTKVNGDYGYYVCEDCLEDNYKKCESCGEYHEIGSMTYVKTEGNESYYCGNCREENLNYCHCCGEWYTGEPHTMYTDEDGNHICSAMLDTKKETSIA